MSKRLIWTALAALAATTATPALAQKAVTIVREIDTDRYDPQKSTSRSGAEVMYMIGDTLVKLGGAGVQDTDDIQLALESRKVGDLVVMEIRRGGEARELSVTIAERPRSN